MTIQGRTSPRWGRDKSARWDSNPDNGFRTRSYPSVAQQEPDPTVIEGVWLPGRPGHAERTFQARRVNDEVHLHTDGWYPTTMTLNERQATFLRDTLNDWFPPE